MKGGYYASWMEVACRMQRRMGITYPPFRWAYLKEWWGWRWYVFGAVRRLLRRLR